MIPAVSQYRPPSHTSSANSARGTQRNCEYRQCALSGGLSAAARPQKIIQRVVSVSEQHSTCTSLPAIHPDSETVSNI